MSTVREEAVVSLGLDTTKIRAGLNKFGSDFRSSIANVSKQWLGALSAGGIIAGINTLLNKFDDLNDKAENLDISTDFLQGMQHLAGKDVVGGVKTFDKAIGELSVKLGEAKSGSAEAIATFEKWGLPLDKIKDADTERVFYMIADAVKAIPDPATRSAAAFELLGKSGKNMSGYLAQGGDAIKQLVAGVDKLDANKVKELAAMKDQLDDGLNRLAFYGGKLLAFFSVDIPSAMGELSTGLENINNALKKTAQDWIAEQRKKVQDQVDIEMAAEEKLAADKLALEKQADEEGRKLAEKRAAEEKLQADARLLLIKINKELEVKAAKDAADKIARFESLKGSLKGSLGNEFMPTLGELVSAGGPYAQDARRAQFLESDIRLAKAKGNDEFATGEMNELQDIRGRLSKAGVYNDPNKAIVDEIAKLSKEIVPGKGLKVDIHMK